MDEKEKTNETEKEKPTENKDDGIQQEATTELDRADSIAERQKRENAL